MYQLKSSNVGSTLYDRKSSGLQIVSSKYRFIVSHIVLDSFMTPETTIGVVGCNALWPDVSVKVNVKIKRGAISSPLS